MMKTVALFLCLTAAVFCQQEPPPFLKNASPEKQREFEGIFTNAGGLTDEQIDKKVQEWISKQSPSIKSAFASFQEEMKTAQTQGEIAHKMALAKFSPAAKEADAKLSKIADSTALSNEQKGQQIDALLKSLPANVRSEIESAMQG